MNEYGPARQHAEPDPGFVSLKFDVVHVIGDGLFRIQELMAYAASTANSGSMGRR